VAPEIRNRFRSVDKQIEYSTSAFGPLTHLRKMTEAQGTWPAVHDDLADLYARSDDAAVYLGHMR
jgi:hypothetical protein